MCQNVPVDTATYWASQVVDFCHGGLKDSGAVFVKQDNIKQEIVLKDMKDIKVEVGEEFGIKVEVKEELVVKEEVVDPGYNSLDNLRSLNDLCLDFVKNEEKVEIKKEPGRKKTSAENRKSGSEKKYSGVQQNTIKKEKIEPKTEEEKKDDKTDTKDEIKKVESNLNVQPNITISQYHGRSKGQHSLKTIDPGDKKQGVFQQESKKKTSLWEASGDLETPRRPRETENQKMTDAVLARKLQQEERRKSERLASLPLLVERKSKKIGLSQACILLPLSRLDEKEREQLQKVWPLSQACQMKQEQEDKKASMPLMPVPQVSIGPVAPQSVKIEIKKEAAPHQANRGVKKEKWLIRSDLALSDLTDIGTEVEVKTEVKVENNDCRDEKVKEEEFAKVKEEHCLENSETRMNETEKRKVSKEQVQFTPLYQVEHLYNIKSTEMN